MLGSDFLFGWLVSEVLKKDATKRAPATSSTSSPAPFPTSSPATPAPAAPAMPVNVAVPPTSSPELGYKKAVEVWRVRPDLALQAGAIAGAGPLALSELERAFPKGWIPCTVVTAQEAHTAQALTKQWSDGRVLFMGPATLGGRRAYRMTKHDKKAPAAPAPIPTPPVAPSVVPVSVSTPAPPAPPPIHPAVLEQMQPPPPPPPMMQAAKTGERQQATVRKGEGLAQVAKRLGRPESAQSAIQLREANVPEGPDARWEKRSLNAPERGIKKAGRAGGLQPGDRLFVPLEWGRVDPARL